MPITVRQKTVKTTPKPDLRSKNVNVTPVGNTFRTRIYIESGVDRKINESASSLSPLVVTAPKSIVSGKLHRNSLTSKSAIIVTPRASKTASVINKSSHAAEKTTDLYASIYQNDTDDDDDDISDEHDDDDVSDEHDGMSCQYLACANRTCLINL